MTVLLLTSAMALGTALLGWWAVPVLGLAYGLWRGTGSAAVEAGGSALMGWSALMAWNWVEGPMVELTSSLGAVMGVPGWALLLTTALFPAVLAGTAATLGSAMRRACPRCRPPDTTESAASDGRVRSS